MGLTQTKLHFKVLKEDWAGVEKRARLHPSEAATKNEYGDLPLHFACYIGRAPADTISALVRAHPPSVHVRNVKGFTPLEVARINYDRHSPHRDRVLRVLGGSNPAPASPPDPSAPPLEGLDGDDVPASLCYRAASCVVCMERPADRVVVPCHHACVCGTCAPSVAAGGVCPMGRCQISAIRVVSGGSAAEKSQYCGEGERNATRNCNECI